MFTKKRGQTGTRTLIYLAGLLIMSLGIVLVILANLGAMPWDVLHVGLFYRFGLSIGSWSVIVGIIILTIAAIISREFPRIGAFSNMILCGIFIDLFLSIPFFQTPDSMYEKLLMYLTGVILNGYGMGIYISAQFGTGPRDSLMIALIEKTGWKVRNIRAGIELLALVSGWLLGGPVFWGTVVYSLFIGHVAGLALPQCQRFTDQLLKGMSGKLKRFNKTEEETNRGVS